MKLKNRTRLMRIFSLFFLVLSRKSPATFRRVSLFWKVDFSLWGFKVTWRIDILAWKENLQISDPVVTAQQRKTWIRPHTSAKYTIKIPWQNKGCAWEDVSMPGHWYGIISLQSWREDSRQHTGQKSYPKEVTVHRQWGSMAKYVTSDSLQDL